MTRLAKPVLRAIAIAIAIAALIDPVFTVQRAQQQRLVLVDLTEAGATAIAGQLRGLDADLEVRTPTAGRVPCAPAERCVIAADGSRDGDVPVDVGSPVSLITVTPPDGPNVSIESATATAHQFGQAAGAVRVVVKGQGVTGVRTTLRVSDEGAVVGSMAVEWKADELQAVDVPWWPIAPAARALRIEAAVEGDDAVAFDNAINLPVTVSDRKLPILILDARPSWSSTFVRRSLEDDPRFIVDHRARVAPALTSGTMNARLDAATLDAVPLLIAGSPDALTAADAELIDRFVRVRGGSLIVLPERAPAGAAAGLFPGEWSEQLLAEPERVGALRAAELLRPRRQLFGSVALSPVVVATPVGNGRIIVSGAMDAWRYRDADAVSFDRFWTSLTAASATAGEKLRIEFGEPLAQSGSRSRFTVHYRALTMPERFEASAVARCGRGAAEQVRLWPGGTSGMFRGELAIAAASSCSIEVTVNDAVARASVAVSARPARAVTETLAKLERAARVSGGVVVTDEDNLAVRLRSSGDMARRAAPEEIYPMRAAWWLVPFVGCLSIEWWLRRRSGSA